jgi:hypothetical protein
LKETGSLRGNANHVYDDFKMAYNWMIEQMKIRLKINMPDDLTYPVWAWYQWCNEDKRKPDLRYSGYGEKGTKLYRIEFEIEDHKVLLSDFDLFHFVLNYWYISKNEKENNVFDEEMDKNNITLLDLQDFNKKSEKINSLRDQIEKSWNLIFDLDWHDEYITSPKHEKSIQAVFWELEWEQVIDIKEFIAR